MAKFFSLKIYPATRKFSQFAIVISKKVAAKAVERNRIKRIIRAAIRLVKDHWPPADYLIIVHSPVKELSPKQINEWFISQNFS